MKRFLFSLTCLLLFAQLEAQDISGFRARAAKGDSVAMLGLAEAFTLGFDVEYDKDSARYWMEKAAVSGHRDAQYLLGLSLIKNLYDNSKYGKGVSWLQKAADNGSVEACLKLSGIYKDSGADGGEGTASKNHYSTRKSFDYAKKAADLGNGQAAIAVYEAYANGRGVSKNIAKGLPYLEIAAIGKNMPVAQIELGKLYFDGKADGKRDLLKAHEMFYTAYENSASSIDLRTEADIEIHKVDRALKQTHNLTLQSGILFSPHAFRYRLREL